MRGKFQDSPRRGTVAGGKPTRLSSGTLELWEAGTHVHVRRSSLSRWQPTIEKDGFLGKEGSRGLILFGMGKSERGGKRKAPGVTGIIAKTLGALLIRDLGGGGGEGGDHARSDLSSTPIPVAKN